MSREEEYLLGKVWFYRDPSKSIEYTYKIRRIGVCSLMLDIHARGPEHRRSIPWVTGRRCELHLTENALVIGNLDGCPIPLELLLEASKILFIWQDDLERMHSKFKEAIVDMEVTWDTIADTPRPPWF